MPQPDKEWDPGRITRNHEVDDDDDEDKILTMAYATYLWLL